MLDSRFLEAAKAHRAGLEANRHLLSLGGLWALGAEPGRPDPAEAEDADLRVLVTRISPYGDVALSRSHGLVAALFREAGKRIGKKVFTDFAFAPSFRDARVLEETGIPPLFGTGTGLPPGAFHMMALSCSHNAEFLNLPWLLHGSGIPLSRGARDRADAPLVILGGAAACHTSPLNGDAEAPGEGGLIDGAVMGDGEASIPALTASLLAGLGRGDRSARIAALADSVPGFYDPASFRHVFADDGKGPLLRIEDAEGEPCRPAARAAIAAPPGDEPEDSHFFSFAREGLGILNLAISTGCPCFCTYCREGWETKPYRERPLDAIERAMIAGKAALGAEAFNPSAFNFDMHQALFPLMETAGNLFARVLPKSQRFDVLARRPETAEAAVRLGKRVFTLGLEGISPRLVRYLGKDLEQREVLEGIRCIARAGGSEVKIFLIATGLERGPDFKAFEDLARAVREASRAGRGRGLRVVFSLTPLIVQPHTPLLYRGRGVEPGRFEKVRSRLKGICRGLGVELRITASVHEINPLQWLATGDRRLTGALVDVSLRSGLRYGKEIPKGAEQALRAALEARDIDPESLYAPPPEKGPFPFSDIAVGVDAGFLRKRYDTALAFESGGYCLGGPVGRGSCRNCGACPDRASRETLARYNPAPPTPGGRWDRLLNAKKNHRIHVFEVLLDDGLRFAPPEWAPRALARCLLLEAPELVPGYHGPGPALEPPGTFVSGRREVALAFLRDTPSEALGKLSDPGFLAAASRHVKGLSIESGGPGTFGDSAPGERVYRLTFPPGTPEEALQRGLARHRRGAPLPLKAVRCEKGLRFTPEGKKAARCPIREARCEGDAESGYRILLRAKAGFDPTLVAQTACPDDPRRVVIRRL